MGRSAKTADGTADTAGWGVDGEEGLNDDGSGSIDGEAKGRGFKKSAVEEGELSTEIMRLARVTRGAWGIFDGRKAEGPNSVGGTRNAERGTRGAEDKQRENQ